MVLALTGVTGLTGRYVFPLLRSLGFTGELRCLIRSTSSRVNLENEQIRVIVGDCRDLCSVSKLLEGADGLIHIAGIQTTEVVLRAAVERAVKRVVFVHTTGMFSKYRSYSQEYARIDALVRESDLDYTIIRPTMIYGNESDRNISRLIRLVDCLPIMPVIRHGQALMQPVHAKDVAWAVVKSYLEANTLRKAYNVGGREPLTYAELLSTIAVALGRELRLVNVPTWMAAVAGYIGQVIPNPLVNIEKIRRLGEDKAFDYSAARIDFGYNPMSFRDGVTEEIAEMRSKGLLRSPR
ncbi:MAG: SDR family oxidoreductase [Bacillota bacterium]